MSCAFDDKRLELHIADASEFVKSADSAAFDVVIIDSSDPVGPAEKLFSEEFYIQCRRILTRRGVLASQVKFPSLFKQVCQFCQNMGTVFVAIEIQLCVGICCP